MKKKRAAGKRAARPQAAKPASKRAASRRRRPAPRRPRQAVATRLRIRPEDFFVFVSRVRPSKVCTVVLGASGHPSPAPTLSRGRGDRLMWINVGSIDRTLTFTVWPFTGPNVSILVPAGGVAGLFTVLTTGTGVERFGYSISPGPTEPTEEDLPPGDPEVITDD